MKLFAILALFFLVLGLFFNLPISQANNFNYDNTLRPSVRPMTYPESGNVMIIPVQLLYNITSIKVTLERTTIYIDMSPEKQLAGAWGRFNVSIIYPTYYRSVNSTIFVFVPLNVKNTTELMPYLYLIEIHINLELNGLYSPLFTTGAILEYRGDPNELLTPGYSIAMPKPNDLPNLSPNIPSPNDPMATQEIIPYSSINFYKTIVVIELMAVSFVGGMLSGIILKAKSRPKKTQRKPNESA